MPLYRKKPVTIEATQWFKNGDHPEDAAHEIFFERAEREQAREGK